MSNELIRQAAEQLYKPPFRYEQGYIWDANNEMVADDDDEAFALRVRGWGRISYKDNPEQLQDSVGEMIAEALTTYWESLSTPSPEGVAVWVCEADIELVRKQKGYDISVSPIERTDLGMKMPLYTRPAPQGRLSDEDDLYAKIGRYMIENCAWHRGNEQGDYMAVFVPHGTDLSCAGTRIAALEAKINGGEG